MAHGSDLQLAKNNTDDGPFGQLIFDSKPSQTISIPTIRVGYGNGSFDMDFDSLASLDRFRNRTSFSFVGKLACKIYQNDVVRLAMQVIHISTCHSSRT